MLALLVVHAGQGDLLAGLQRAETRSGLAVHGNGLVLAGDLDGDRLGLGVGGDDLALDDVGLGGRLRGSGGLGRSLGGRLRVGSVCDGNARHEDQGQGQQELLHLRFLSLISENHEWTAPGDEQRRCQRERPHDILVTRVDRTKSNHLQQGCPRTKCTKWCRAVRFRPTRY